MVVKYKQKLHLQPVLTLIVLLVLLLVAQVIGGGLSLASFKKLHMNGVVSGCDAIGSELAGKIERALRLGKPLDNFIGMDKLLQQGQQLNPAITNLAIMTSDFSVVYTQNDISLPENNDLATIVASAKENNRAKKFLRELSSYHVIRDNNNYLLFSLCGRADVVQGYLCLSFSDDRVGAKQNELVYASVVALGIITLIAALLLASSFYFIFNNKRLQRRRIIYLFLFVILGGAQLGYSVYNIGLFQKHYVAISIDKAVTMAAVLKHDIDFFLDRGVSLKALYKIDERMAQTVKRVPEISTIEIIDSSRTTLYRAGSTDVVAPSLVKNIPLLQHGVAVGTIRISLDEGVLHRKTKEIALDALTLVALSFLFIMELMVVLFATLLAPLVNSKDDSTKLDVGEVMIRPATFIFIYAASLCYSFVPLYMEQLYRPLWGLSRELLLGLPLTMEMLGGTFVLIPVGWWIDRKGWHQPFITGSVICVAGSLLSGLAEGQAQFFAARTLMGMGYGMVWMAAQGFVLLNAKPSHRTRGISNVVAGIFSGIICGNAVGAMLAQQFGYRGVFLVAAGLIVLALVFVLIFMRHNFGAPVATFCSAPERRCLRSLFFDRQALLLFGCSLFPYSIAMVALLYYATPLYLNQLGASQSTIGRVMMLFGLCMIFIAPQVSRFADRLEDKRPLVIAGGVLGSLSLLTFWLSDSFWVVPLAITLLGLSVSISAASRNVLTVGLPITQRLGTTRVMGVYRSVDKLGQAVGPLLLALLLGFCPFDTALGVLGGGYLLLTMLLMRWFRGETIVAVTPFDQSKN